MRSKRWERRKEARPSEIVAAALHQFAQKGFAATRLDDVAAAANVSKGTLYLYFANKQELFEAVVRETVLPNLERADAIFVAHRGSTPALLRRLARRMVRLLDSEVGSVPKLVIAEAGNFPELAAFYAETVVQRGMSLIARLLQRGIDRGEFRPVDIPSTLPLVIAPFLMMALWKHSLGAHTRIQFAPDAVLEAHLDLLLRGLAPDAAPKTRKLETRKSGARK